MRNCGNEWIQRRKPFIIAELGSNIFPYSREKLVDYCLAASQAGADAVKIQLYFAEHFPLDEQEAKQATVFPRAELAFFAEAADLHGLAWGASVFDRGAVDMLVGMGADFLKLATREEHNNQLRAYANRRFKGTILRSVDWTHSIPWHHRRFPREVTLACIPEYPTDMGDALDSLMPLQTFSIPDPWGWSSHTEGISDCVVVARCWPSVIEKHLYLSPDDPEAAWSVSGEHLRAIVEVCKSRKEPEWPDFSSFRPIELGG